MDTRANNCRGLSFCKNSLRQRGISQPKEKIVDFGKTSVTSCSRLRVYSTTQSISGKQNFSVQSLAKSVSSYYT